MQKIAIVTGTRAEYGLLYWLIKGVHEDPELELQLYVTGMHLSPLYGQTWKQIEEDGFPITRKIDMELSSDTGVGVAKSTALGLMGFAEAFDALRPDVVVMLGDRTELLAAAEAALLIGVPVAHIHGGELTEGAYDDAIRHAITKMSHLHFAANEVYRQRIIQLGEQPSTVYTVGALGMDSIKKLTLLDTPEVEAYLGRKLAKHNLLITFHPVTLEQETAAYQFEQLLDALDELEDSLLIFTKPNSDKNGHELVRLIDSYVAAHPEKAVAFTNMGQLRYLSTVRLMDAVVGNSSSGLIRVPAFNIPTVNIGDRQKGRLCGPTILNCLPTKAAIAETLQAAFTFDTTQQYDNPYGGGNASERIVYLLKTADRPNLKKAFYDLPTVSANN